MLARYSVESAAISRDRPDQDKVLEFYRTWLGRFLAQATAEPGSPSHEMLLIKAESLANGVGRFDVSVTLAKQILQRQTTWQSRLRWSEELGEVAGQAPQASTRPTDPADAAFYFRQAVAIGDAHFEELKASASSVRDYVVAAATLAQLEPTSNSEKKTGDTLKSLASAQRLLLSAPQETSQFLASVGYDQEYFISTRAQAYVSDGKIEETREALKELQRLPAKSTRWPPSYYAWKLATVVSPQKDAGYCKFLSKWLGDNPADDWTPFATYHLAAAYLTLKQYGDALPLYERLYRSDADVLKNADRPTHAQASGGWYADVLFNLGFIYAQLDVRDRAREAFARFLAYVPRDPRVNAARGWLTALNETAATEQVGVDKVVGDLPLGPLPPAALPEKDDGQVHADLPVSKTNWTAIGAVTAGALLLVLSASWMALRRSRRN